MYLLYIYICIYIYIYPRKRDRERERECSQGSSCDVLPGGSLAKNITITSANSSRSTNLICASDLFLFHIGSRPAVNMSPWSICDWAWKLRALDSQLQGSNSLIKTGIVFFAACQSCDEPVTSLPEPCDKFAWYGVYMECEYACSDVQEFIARASHEKRKLRSTRATF